MAPVPNEDPAFWGMRASPCIPPKGESAVMVHARNPLAPPEPVSVRPFTPVRDLAPDARGPLMLRFNGVWLPRKDWGRIVAPGDVIEWHELPQGGNGSRTVLMIAVVVVSILAGPQFGAWINSAGGLGLTAAQATALGTIAINVVGSALVNALVPLQQANLGGGAFASPGSVYNVSTSGNQARLGQPIPVIYGRHRIFPDFASQPYIEFRDNDQYFHAFYCVGQGHYNIPPGSLFIDDTLLSHFTDVWSAVLSPGSLPTRVHANVVTAPEVTGQEIQGGTYTAGFAACGPRQTASHIGVDVLFDRLGVAQDDGSMADKSVPIRFEARTIDDFGVATSAWFVLGSEVFTAATTTPQRYSRKFTLPTPARVEVRCVRTDAKDDNSRVFNDPMWGGLRAYLSTPATLSSTATHFELVIRASEQLSGLSQRKVNMIPRRMLKTWNPTTGWSADPVETRSIAWALADLWKDPTYGDGLPDERIDLQTLYELDQVWSARQDRLDIVFDSRVTSWDAAKTIAQAGRATPFRRMGVNTLARDSQQSLPVTAYTTRNMLPGASIGYALPTEQTADGIVVEYFDNRSWDWREVDCPAPGKTVRSASDPRYNALLPSMSNPVRLRLAGVTGAIQAEREGLYQAAQNVYRRKFPAWTTELQGMLPAYGSLVVCAPPMATLIQAGDVAHWQGTARIATLTEPPQFEPGKAHFIVLHRDDGSVTEPIEVTPGAGPNDVVLADDPDFPIVFADPDRERPKYFFGTSEGHRVMTRVLGIRKTGRGSDGSRTIELNGVVEDDRVHMADNHLLPGPGVIQDPVDSGEAVPDESGGVAVYPLVNLTDHEIWDTNLTGRHAGFILSNDGTAGYRLGATTGLYAGEWLLNGKVETSVAGEFEARATFQWGETGTVEGATPGGPEVVLGDAIGTWLSLDTTREWHVVADFDTRSSASLLIEIRDASGLVQTSHRIELQCVGLWS